MNYVSNSQHWADQAARRVLTQKGDRDVYTVASGITPSGTVHIGNFREVITVDFVARSLQAMGKKVRFIYSWDNFDTFRKVPKNIPKQEEFKAYLRMPISRIPDPRGAFATYDEFGIKTFEDELKRVGVNPEFIYQEKQYAAGRYAEQIKHALVERKKIIEILNRFRTEPLEESWLPTSIYCEKCQKDTVKNETFDGEWGYSYECKSCGNIGSTDIRSCKNIKLAWRVDWPMRWAIEKVDFEPGGKEHSSAGGSYDTAKHIVKEIWNVEPPTYQQYDFVMIKGGTGKMSSSSGDLFTLSQALEVYTPQIVRWIFANQRPNHDFALAFDIDVIKCYDEFDRAEELAFKKPNSEDDQKWIQNRRALELSTPDGEFPEVKPFRPSFRELCNHLQIFDFDIKRSLERYYRAEVKNSADEILFFERAEKCIAWIKTHAPEEFKFSVRSEKAILKVSELEDCALKNLTELLRSVDLEAIDPTELNQKIYDDVIKKNAIDSKQFFSLIYQKLIARDRGPRLPGLIKEIGQSKMLNLLEN